MHLGYTQISEDHCKELADSISRSSVKSHGDSCFGVSVLTEPLPNATTTCLKDSLIDLLS